MTDTRPTGVVKVISGDCANVLSSYRVLHDNSHRVGCNLLGRRSYVLGWPNQIVWPWLFYSVRILTVARVLSVLGYVPQSMRPHCLSMQGYAHVVGSVRP